MSRLRVQRHYAAPWSETSWVVILRHPYGYEGEHVETALHDVWVGLEQTYWAYVDWTEVGSYQRFATEALARGYAIRMTAQLHRYVHKCGQCNPSTRSPLWLIP